jgi:hypothetical protein
VLLSIFNIDNINIFLNFCTSIFNIFLNNKKLNKINNLIFITFNIIMEAKDGYVGLIRFKEGWRDRPGVVRIIQVKVPTSRGAIRVVKSRS